MPTLVIATTTPSRSFGIPRDLAENLDEKHIVIHGHDLDGNGGYGGRTTDLRAPREADCRLPAASWTARTPRADGTQAVDGAPQHAPSPAGDGPAERLRA